MTVMHIAGLIGLGLGVGFVSGLLGIGGAILIIPALVSLYGFSQPLAAGTSLAFMLPPVGVFAVMTYHRAGHVSVPTAAWLAAAFAVGTWVASTIAASGRVPQQMLRTLFGVFLLYVAGNYLFRGDRTVWAVTRSVGLVAGAVTVRQLFLLLGRRWDRRIDGVDLYRARRTQTPGIEYEI